MNSFSHFDKKGNAKMVDVSPKDITTRTARAKGMVKINPKTADAIKDLKMSKGDPMETAKIAGIMAAKKTSGLIPLCHPLSIEHLDVKAFLKEDCVILESSVKVTDKTGAEMEALTAVSVAALTIYDMCKAMDKSMIIGDIRLVEKTGGSSGDYSEKKQ